MTQFTPSPEQSSFFTWLRTGTGNLILLACAGSGKTTALVEGLKCLPVRDLQSMLPPATTMISFAKPIADALRARCPRHVNSSTFHALGLRALKDSGLVDPRNRDLVDGGKMRKRMYSLLGKSEDVKDALRLASIARSVPVQPSEMTDDFFSDFVERYQIRLDDTKAVFTATRRAIEMGMNDLTTIDYDEMLYLPCVLGAKFSPQDWVFVDEAQDTNDIQLAILERLAKPVPEWCNHNEIDNTTCLHCGKETNMNAHGYIHDENFFVSPTRFTFVGDPHQAIYAFRGANSDSMSRIAARFSCTQMPLDVSFRCPQLIVAEAQKYLARQKFHACHNP